MKTFGTSATSSATQSNKINALVPYISCLETLDRLSPGLQTREPAGRGKAKTLEVLIQVNTPGEPTKAGLDPDEVEPFIRTIAGLDALKVRGLMTIGLNAEPEVASLRLACLREIRQDGIREENIEGVAMEELSDGHDRRPRSGDRGGPRPRRVGSAIFGSRPRFNHPGGSATDDREGPWLPGALRSNRLCLIGRALPGESDPEPLLPLPRPRARSSRTSPITMQ